MSDFKMELILVPTDFSGHSDKAYRYAVNLAGVFSAKIVLLHVLDTRVVENIYHIHQLTPEKAREQMRASAEAGAQTLLAAEYARGVEVRCEIREGLPSVIVKEVAKTLDADLIVMGTHGRTGITQLLFGTTAEGVVRGAPCPVLTVNP